MIGPKSALCLAVTLLVACLVARPAQGQDTACRLCSEPQVRDGDGPAKPIRLEVRSRLDFDSLIFAGFGQGVMRVGADGSAETSGPVNATGARVMPGSVTIRGEPGRAVRVEMPGSVQLYGDRGGAMRIESLTTDLPTLPVIGPDGELSFRFGGVLKVDGEADGGFRGDVDIVVEYL